MTDSHSDPGQNVKQTEAEKLLKLNRQTIEALVNQQQENTFFLKRFARRHQRDIEERRKELRTILVEMEHLADDVDCFLHDPYGDERKWPPESSERLHSSIAALNADFNTMSANIMAELPPSAFRGPAHDHRPPEHDGLLAEPSTLDHTQNPELSNTPLYLKELQFQQRILQSLLEQERRDADYLRQLTIWLKAAVHERQVSLSTILKRAQGLRSQVNKRVDRASGRRRKVHAISEDESSGSEDNHPYTSSSYGTPATPFSAPPPEVRIESDSLGANMSPILSETNLRSSAESAIILFEASSPKPVHPDVGSPYKVTLGSPPAVTDQDASLPPSVEVSFTPHLARAPVPMLIPCGELGCEGESTSNDVHCPDIRGLLDLLRVSLPYSADTERSMLLGI